MTKRSAAQELEDTNGSPVQTNGSAKKQKAITTTEPSRPHNTWFYPKEFENDLKGVDIPPEFIGETIACAWEYTRSVIPHYTNWPRYMAFARTIIIGTIAEFRGELVDIASSNKMLGYDLDEVLDGVFAGTPGHEEMKREYRTFLLVTGDKASHRRDSELFRRYVNALAKSPRDWFRLRDCDALARFTIAAALACNDIDSLWFTNPEWEIITEICDTLYDSVAFHKHRAEGETNNTFAYAGESMRLETHHRCRELLWRLDTAWAQKPTHQCVLNFMRYFGGPIHMTMRRYRFIEDNLTIGNPETEYVVKQTRKNFKLWNRVDAIGKNEAHSERYVDAIARSEELMFPGLVEMLESGEQDRCKDCRYRQAYGAETSGRFGGVELCQKCRQEWQSYLEALPARAAEVFPELLSVGAVDEKGLGHAEVLI